MLYITQYANALINKRASTAQSSVYVWQSLESHTFFLVCVLKSCKIK